MLVHIIGDIDSKEKESWRLYVYLTNIHDSERKTFTYFAIRILYILILSTPTFPRMALSSPREQAWTCCIHLCVILTA